MRVRIAALALFAFAPAPAAAWDGSKAYRTCVAAAKEVDREIAGCNQEEFEREDKALNAAYAARLAKAEGKLKAAIQKAQRLWLGARDPTCEAESLVFEGGTLENVAYTSCEVRLTIERIAWLKTLGD